MARAAAARPAGLSLPVFPLAAASSLGLIVMSLRKPVGVTRADGEEETPPFVPEEWREDFEFADGFRAVAVK
jgi:hypothetical protein